MDDIANSPAKPKAKRRKISQRITQRELWGDGNDFCTMKDSNKVDIAVESLNDMD